MLIDESTESKSSPEVTKQTAIGSTITISKPPICKGTITIEKSDKSGKFIYIHIVDTSARIHSKQI